MTTEQALLELKKAGKPIHLSHLYRLLSILGIKPLGRARPQNYPSDTASRILNHFGLTTSDIGRSSETAPGHRNNGKSIPLVSIRQLKAVQPKKGK